MTRFPQDGVQLPESPIHPRQNFNGLDIWPWDWGGIEVADAQTKDGQTVAWAADCIGKHKSNQPFYLTVGIYRPHSPWYAPKAYSKNTIIALTSDHGWYLGEKNMWHKGKLWERATHVPLTLFAPGVTRADSVSDQPVSLIDWYPTFTDLAGLAKPDHLDGESLRPLLSDPSAQRARLAITAMGGEGKASYSARMDRWRYIR
jgi:hypothetical protein